MHTRDVVKRQNNENTEKHKYDFRDHSRRLHVLFDAQSKELIDVKHQKTVFLTGLDKFIGADCIVQKTFR